MYKLNLIFICSHLHRNKNIFFCLKIQEKLHLRSFRGNTFLVSVKISIAGIWDKKYYLNFAGFYLQMLPFLPLCSFYKQQPNEMISVFNQRTSAQRFDHLTSMWFYKSLKVIFLPKILPGLVFLDLEHTRVKPAVIGVRLPSGFSVAAPVSVTTQWGWGWTCCSDLIGWRKLPGFPTAAAAGNPF